MKNLRSLLCLLAAGGMVLAGGCRGAAVPAAPPGITTPATPPAPNPLDPIPNARTAAEKIVNAAKAEARRQVRYDPSYYRIPYPGGDVPADRGACTDVVIRSLRAAGYDLQKLMHQDMAAHWSAYPHTYGLGRPDANIDHRRVPNQMVFMRRHATALPMGTTGKALASWKPGDIVYWRLLTGQGHCGIISNVTGATGLPMAIHNVGITAQEDCLTSWKIIGHYRYPR